MIFDLPTPRKVAFLLWFSQSVLIDKEGCYPLFDKIMIYVNRKRRKKIVYNLGFVTANSWNHLMSKSMMKNKFWKFFVLCIWFQFIQRIEHLCQKWKVKGRKNYGMYIYFCGKFRNWSKFNRSSSITTLNRKGIHNVVKHFSNFSCMFLNLKIFFPIWILIVLIC